MLTDRTVLHSISAFIRTSPPRATISANPELVSGPEGFDRVNIQSQRFMMVPRTGTTRREVDTIPTITIRLISTISASKAIPSFSRKGLYTGWLSMSLHRAMRIINSGGRQQPVTCNGMTMPSIKLTDMYSGTR